MRRERMPFGRYRGRRLDEIPPSYLRWALESCDNLTLALRQAIRQFLEELERDGDDDEVPIHPGPAALSPVRAVVDRWYRTLAMRFHPDRGGNHDRMLALNMARDLLVELLEGS